MSKQCNNSVECVEANILNSKPPMFASTDTDRVYYSDFGYTNSADDNKLPYGKDIQ